MTEMCKDCLLEGTPACETCWRNAETFSEEEKKGISSSTNGDYSPSNPWNAPGMSIKDFI